MNLSTKAHRIAAFLVALVFFASFSSAAAFYFRNDISNLISRSGKTEKTPTKVVTTDEAVKNDEAANQNIVAKTNPEPAPATAIKKDPPKHSGTSKITGVTTTNTDGSRTTVVSDGGASSTELEKIADLGPAASIRIVDETGQYPTLGDTLRAYINSNLLKGDELPYLYQITIRNAGDSHYEGQYSGSYTVDGNGKIVSAFGYIVLNVYYHKDQPSFVDFMKLTLAHEYGHHYTQYHKWINLNLLAGVRFPDNYYAVRPLSKETTAVDYSKKWENCESEIIAEDYSYFYSGYGYHAMEDTYGFPSAGTKTWLISLGNATSQSSSSTTQNTPAPAPTPPPSTETPEEPPSETQTETPAETPAPAEADSLAPVITIINPTLDPAEWTTGDLIIEARATDNVDVAKIEIYVGSQLLATQAENYIKISIKYFEGHLGNYVFKVKAYDAAGNVSEASITVKKK